MFQNSAVAWSLQRFLPRVHAWLSTGDAPIEERSLLLCVALVLSLLMSLVALYCPRALGVALVVAAGAVPAAITLTSASGLCPWWRATDEVAVLDVSHDPLCIGLRGERSSLGQLSALLSRLGYLPIELTGSARMRGAPAVHVIVEPSRAYSSREADRIGERVQSGMRLLVLFSPLGASNLEAVFQRLGGITVEGPNLGAVPHRFGRFRAPYAPRFSSAHQVQCSPQVPWIPCYTFGRYDIAIAVRHGEGIAVVIGDPWLAQGRGLFDAPERPNFGNVQFLKNCMAVEVPE